MQAVKVPAGVPEDAYCLPHVDWMLEEKDEKVLRVEFASRIVKAARDDESEIWTPKIDAKAQVNILLQVLSATLLMFVTPRIICLDLWRV